MDNVKGWRTLLIGALVAALGGIQATDLVTVVPAQYIGVVVAGIGLLVMYLRTITDTPVGIPTQPVANDAQYDPQNSRLRSRRYAPAFSKRQTRRSGSATIKACCVSINASLWIC